MSKTRAAPPSACSAERLRPIGSMDLALVVSPAGQQFAELCDGRGGLLHFWLLGQTGEDVSVPFEELFETLLYVYLAGQHP